SEDSRSATANVRRKERPNVPHADFHRAHSGRGYSEVGGSVRLLSWEASRPSRYARLRPIRSPSLLPIRMNAADTSASSAIADWTPLTVVCRSRTTDEIDTFISDVSTTRTNMAIARRI